MIVISKLLLFCVDLPLQALEAAGAVSSISNAMAGSSTAASSAPLSAPAAAGGSAGGGGDSWVVSVREKALVDVLLSAAAAAPSLGLMLAELAWGLGPGVGEELLRRMDWLLQVRDRAMEH
jgi:hypothetical protein